MNIDPSPQSPPLGNDVQVLLEPFAMYSSVYRALLGDRVARSQQRYGFKKRSSLRATGPPFCLILTCILFLS